MSNEKARIINRATEKGNRETQDNRVNFNNLKNNC